MLADTLMLQYPPLRTLADAWLASGATSFGLWKNNRPLALWPAQDPPPRPTIVAPLRVGDTLVGAIGVAGISSTAARSRLIADATLIANLLRLEGELKRMAADLAESQEHILSLCGLSDAMRDTMTIEETLSCLARETMGMLKAYGSFVVFTSTTVEMPLLVQYGQRQLPPDQIRELFERVRNSEQELHIPAQRLAGELDAGEALLIVPIWVQGTIAAALGVIDKPAGFTSADAKLARAIGAVARSKIENVQLHQQTLDQAQLRSEMEFARRVQRALLPEQLPEIVGLDLFACSRPALQMSGDFYDIISQPNRPTCFVLGDVAGKGVSAALLMTMTRTAIRSKASFMPEPTPETVIRHSNEDLFVDLAHLGAFATAFVCQYHAPSRTLTYANAGHAPVIYRPAGWPARLLRADGTAMGVLDTSRSRNHAIELGPGDLLVIATDGFSDAREPHGEYFGHDRLLQLVEQQATQPAQVIADSLFAAVDHFTNGSPQDDDQTLIVIKGVAV